MFRLAHRNPNPFLNQRSFQLRRLATQEETPFLDEEIEVEQEEHAIVWFNSLFPITRNPLDPRGYFARSYAQSMKTMYTTLLPPSKTPITVTKTIPNIKEGGMFLFLTHAPSASTKEIITSIDAYLTATKYRSPQSFRLVKAFHVKGSPFMEDMVGRLPSNRLRIEFEGPDLSSYLRKYGRIVNIQSQPLGAKDAPRHAIVRYAWVSSASAARNCAHGQKIDSTRLSISYEKALGVSGTIVKWSSAHPKIMIPLLIGLLAGLTYLVFDPIRVSFVQHKLTSQTSILTQIKGKFQAMLLGVGISTNGFLGMFGSEKVSGWQDYLDEEARLLNALRETPETMYLVSGPRSSGKSELIRSVYTKLPCHLIIDCEELVNIPEHEMLARLASQVGFYPQLNFIVSASGMIDTLIAATTGAKAGLSTSYESQVRKILDILGLAINQIALDQHAPTTSDSLEPTNTKHDDQAYPVIFIKGFMSRDRAKNDYIYDLLANWAGLLAENHLAHVVFVSNNPGAVKVLSKVIPSKSIETVNLHDATFENAMIYVGERIGKERADENKERIDALGGRRTDLESFIQKIRNGSTGADAFTDIVLRSVSELRKVGLEEGVSVVAGDRLVKNWDAIQFWKLIEQLGRYGKVDYDDAKMHNLFKGDERPIQQMENYGLIGIEHVDGHPKYILPGRPIYTHAFVSLLTDSKLCAEMRIKTSKKLRKDEEQKIKDWESEMKTIAEILSMGGDGRGVSRDVRKGLGERMAFLGGVVAVSNGKCVGFYDEELDGKRVLKMKA